MTSAAFNAFSCGLNDLIREQAELNEKCKALHTGMLEFRDKFVEAYGSERLLNNSDNEFLGETFVFGRELSVNLDSYAAELKEKEPRVSILGNPLEAAMSPRGSSPMRDMETVVTSRKSSLVCEMDTLGSTIAPSNMGGFLSSSFSMMSRNFRSEANDASCIAEEVSGVLEEESFGAGLSVFLSHKQSNAQDAVSLLKVFLEARLPSASFWLDLEQVPTAEGMREGVRKCTHFVLFVTEGVSKSSWVQFEIECAVEFQKPIILVAEKDPRHGAADISNEIAGTQSPVVKSVLLDNVCIPWYREPAFQQVSLDLICEQLCSNVRNESSMRSKNWSHGHGALMYGDGKPVFDKWFVGFCSVSGLYLPGSTFVTKLWSFFLLVLAFSCTSLCFLRMSSPGYPGFSDYRDALLVPMMHLGIILKTMLTLSVLRSEEVKIMVRYHLREPILADRLRAWTRRLTFLVCALSMVAIVTIQVIYTSASFDDDKFHVINQLDFYLHAAYSPFLMLQLFGGCVVSVALQVFMIMCLSTAFIGVSNDIEQEGLQAYLRRGRVAQLKDRDVVAIQILYLQAWKRCRWISDRLALANFPITVVWVLNLSIHVYLLATGDGDLVNPRQQYWKYLVRQLILFFLDIYIMVPYIAAEIRQNLRRSLNQLLIANPSLRSHLLDLVKSLKFDSILACPRMVPYLLVLILCRWIVSAVSLRKTFA